MATKTAIKGHALKADGAAFDENANRIDPSTAGGDGSALCQCGALSPIATSRKARIDWHKEHKADAAAEAEAPALDLEPEDEAPAEAPAEAPVEAPADPDTPARKVEFPHAKKWWKALGKDGAQLLLSDFPVTVDFDDKERVLHLSGADDVTDSAADFLDYAWTLALQEFEQWKRSDAVYEARGLVTKDTYKQSRDRLKAQEDFLRSFCLDHEELQRVFLEK